MIRLLALLGRIPGYLVVALRFIQNRIVGPQEIASSYTRAAETYLPWVQVMAGLNQSVVRQALPHLPSQGAPGNYLDLTCGPGNWTGYLSEALDAQGLNDYRITGVDLSPGMITQARKDLKDRRIDFFVAEALTYLRSCPPESLDGVICGWGLIYLPRGPVLREIRRVLKPGGVAAVIMNRRGTLGPLEDIFLHLMAQNPWAISKIMVTRFKLPSSLKSFARWFRRRGFTEKNSSQGVVERTFSTAKELVDWLTESGVLAGTEFLMNHDGWKDAFLDQVAQRFQHPSGFSVRHAYVYGVFKKETSYVSQ